MGEIKFFSKLLIVFFLGGPAFADPHLTLQGRILRPDGVTPVTANLTFRVQIYSPAPNNCLLYEETNSFNTSTTNGAFTLNVGTGTRPGAAVDGGFDLEKVFSNTGTFDLSGAPGACSAGYNDYSPSSLDSRVLVYSFNDGNGWQTVPAMAINWVPMSFEALQVGGFKADHLLRAVDAAGNPTNISALLPAQVIELLKLLDGTSTTYVKPGSANFTSAPTWNGTPTGANDLTNKTYVDTAIANAMTSVDGDSITTGTIGGNTTINTTGNIVTTGTVQGAIVAGTQIRIHNGANYIQLSAPALGGNNVLFTLPDTDGDPGQVLSTDGNGILTWINPATGSVTNVTASAPLSSSGGTTPDISISKADSTTDGYLSSTDWNTFNNKLGTTTNFAGDVIGTYNTTIVDKIKGVGVDYSTAPANGNFFKFDGTNWVPADLSAVDIPNLDASAITTGTLPIARGGTGATSVNDGQLVVGGPLGASYANFDCAQGQVIAFNALGQVVCESTGGANQLLRLDNTASTSIAGSFGIGGNFAVTGTSALNGNVTMGADLSVGGNTTLTGDLNANGNINMAASKHLGLSQHAADPSTAGWGAAEKGRTWFNTTSNEIKYWDGGAVKVLGAVGAAVTSVTATPSTPIVIGGTATSPTVGIDKADATTDGYLSSTDWNTFNNKLGTSLNDGEIWVGNSTNVATSRTPSGDVTMSNAGVFSVEKIRGTNVSINSLTGGDFLKFDGTNWINAPLASGDIPNLDASKITSGTLDAGRLPAFSGDVTTSAGSSATTVEKLQTYPLDLSTPPGNGKVLKFNGTAWVADDDNSTDATKLPLAGGTMSGAIDMDGNNILKAGNIEMSASKHLGLSQHAADPSTAGWGAAEKGRTWFNSTSNEIKYWDGAVVRVLGVAGSGISSFNGSNENSQSFGVPTLLSGTSLAPAWSTNTGTGVHTLNIPMAADAGVTAGLISKTQYDTFNNKLGPTSNFAGDVSGTYDNTSVDKIKGTAVSINALANGNILKYDGTNWVNANLAAGDIPDLDASKITSGTLPIARGGTGATSIDDGKLVVGGPLGATYANFDCTQGQVIAFNALGQVVCENTGGAGQLLRLDGASNASIAGNLSVGGNLTLGASKLLGLSQHAADPNTAGWGASEKGRTWFNSTSNQIKYWDGATVQTIAPSGTGFIDGGNSFGQAADLGTNDNYALNFKTNNATHMTILPDGTVGIGTAHPESALDVNGAVSARGIASPAVAPAGQGRIYFDSTDKKFKVSQDGGAYVDLVNTSSGSITGVTAGAGLTGGGTSGALTLDVGAGTGIIVNANDIAVDVGTTAGKIVQVQTGGKLPALDGSDLTNLSAGSISTGVLPIARGGTNNGSLAVTNGGVIYTDGSKLMNSGAGTSGQVLKSNGAGAPTWGSVGVAGGGTGVTSYTTGDMLYASGASTLAKLGIGASGSILTSTGSAPQWTASLSVTQGGTGRNTAFAGDGVIISNMTGTQLTALNCANGEVIKFGATGNVMCGTDISGSSSGFVNGGNSFGGDAYLGTNDNERLFFETNGIIRMQLDSGGAVCAGTNCSSSLDSQTRFLVNNSAWNLGTSGSIYNLKSTLDYAPSSTSSANLYGFYSSAENDNTSPTTGTTYSGYFLAKRGAAGNLTGLTGIHARVENSATGTLSTATGGYFEVLRSTGTVTNGYGLHIGNVEATNKWSLYASDATAPSYFAGNIGIGKVDPTSPIHIVKNSSVTTGVAGQEVEVYVTTSGVMGAENMGTHNYANISGTHNVTGTFYATKNMANYTGTGTLSYMRGTLGLGQNDGTGTISDAMGVLGEFQNKNTGTTTSASGTHGLVTNEMAGGTITHARGLSSRVRRLAGTITNGYGLYIDQIEATNKYSIYATDSSAPSVLAGSISVGQTVSPTSALDMNGAATMRQMAAPAVSAANTGRIYFDSTAKKFKVSENGGAYVDLVNSSSGSITGVTAGAGLTGGGTSGAITLDVGAGTGIVVNANDIAVDVGTTAGKIVQVQTGGKLPALDGSDLTNLDAGDISAGTLAVARGGTGTGSYTTGDMLYASGASAISKLGIGASGSILTSTGTAPQWSASLGVTQGGTGRTTAFTGNGVVISNAAGTQLSALNCTSGQIIKFNGSGVPVCGTDDSGAGSGFVNGGNSFGGVATLGTNDNQPLRFETNGTDKMTILANGQVGIGTTNPSNDMTITRPSGGLSVQLETAGTAGGDQVGFNLVTKKNGNNIGTATNKGWQILARGDNFTVPSLSNDFLFTFWNGSTWNDALVIDSVTGNVGIGDPLPSEKLVVDGSIRATDGAITAAYESDTDLNIDFSKANIITTSASCGAVTLNNMQDGGSYTLIVTGSSSGTCTFSHAGVTWPSGFKFAPANGPTDTSSGGETVYTFLKVGSKIYVSWITGMR